MPVASTYPTPSSTDGSICRRALSLGSRPGRSLPTGPTAVRARPPVSRVGRYPGRVIHTPIAELLQRVGTIVLDGGLATEPERSGHDLHDPLWSARVLVEAPGASRVVHSAYFEAGADVAISASYQATFEGFAGRGIEGPKAAALMRRSVELAREAASGDGLVAASVGPYGAMLGNGAEYTGDYDR